MRFSVGTMLVGVTVFVVWFSLLLRTPILTVALTAFVLVVLAVLLRLDRLH